MPPAQPGSSSLTQPDYWWYRARADLLHVVFGPYLGTPGGPSTSAVPTLRASAGCAGTTRRVTLDLFPDGLVPGEGVCGSAEALPFADEAFDVVAAFDVVEHCEDDALAVAELARVLAPGAGCCCPCPPTSGRGRTTTSGPGTTAATPGPG